MQNAKKILERIQPKKRRSRMPRAQRVDLSTLADAVVDGVLVVPAQGRILFERDGAVHRGYVWGYKPDVGTVTVWDETRCQFWAFNARISGDKVTCKVDPIAIAKPA